MNNEISIGDPVEVRKVFAPRPPLLGAKIIHRLDARDLVEVWIPATVVGVVRGGINVAFSDGGREAVSNGQWRRGRKA